MKKNIVALFTIILMSTFAGPSFAQMDVRGSTIIPSLIYQSAGSTYTNTYLIITNITNSPVTCRVKTYDHNGNDLSQYGYVYTGGNSNWAVVSTGAIDFELPAHSARMYTIKNYSPLISILAHSIVEWSSSDVRLRKALVASVYSGNNFGSHSTFLINNGEPF